MNKVAIFCAGQNGDILTISSVLRYRNELWGDDCKIIWFIDDNNRDLLKYQDVELRTFPRGFGYPKMVEEENAKLISEGKEPIWTDWQPLVDWDNRMNKALQVNYPELAEFTHGYFPAPHQQNMQQRHGQLYAEISKKVFGVSMYKEWHPVLKFSEQEKIDVIEFIDNFFYLNKICCIETFAGSGQSKITDQMIRETMCQCREVFGVCNFVFMSHKYLNGNEQFPADFKHDRGVYFASNFTVRQCAMIVKECDLFISVSSGISVASSCWDNKGSRFKMLQYCGSEQCSTSKLAIGEYHLVTHDEKPFHVAELEYFEKLNQILNTIK